MRSAGRRSAGGRTAAGPLVLAAFALVALAGSACSGSGFRYVKSTENHTYFKVPEKWKVFDRDDLLKATNDARTASGIRFIAFFDGDPSPSLDHEIDTASFPIGKAYVRELDLEERDAFSLASLRNEVIPIDDILDRKVGSIELVEPPRSVVKDNGLAGSRLVYTVHLTKGSSFTVHQTGLVDPATRVVYFFWVGCEQRCYSQHRSTIDQIAESWTIKEP